MNIRRNHARSLDGTAAWRMEAFPALSVALPVGAPSLPDWPTWSARSRVSPRKANVVATHGVAHLRLVVVSCAVVAIAAMPVWAKSSRIGALTARIKTVQHAGHPIEGKVLAVRRGSRELTIATGRGVVQRAVVARGADGGAAGRSGLDAVRVGANIHARAEVGRNGTLVVRSLRVR
ncbi:MAG TPA: hypothetical protein VMW17_09390 [Candidatus Binatia bacterium]|nr:hypothetical protein [Candidatus Binatia bacterium]